MGASQSSSSSSPSFVDSLSKDDIANIVASYGTKYEAYGSVITENGVDGGFLASLTENDFTETLDDLDITSRLHRRKFLTEFQKHVLGSNNDASMSSHNSSSNHSRRSNNSSSNASSSSHMSVMSGACEEVSQFFDVMEAENLRLRQSLLEIEQDHNRRRATSLKMRSPPMQQAALVVTDIEGSTSLWEANPVAMRKALNLHDQIMRRRITAHAGYEITTEGDAFAIAFHEAADALGFALGLQTELNRANWSQDILDLDWARQDETTGRRGPRVRVSIHMGQVTTQKDPCSGRVTYAGDAWSVVKSLEQVAVGGQIVTSYDTWSAAVHLKDSRLGSPRIATLGVVHAVAQKKTGCTTSAPAAIPYLEVAPASLNIIGTAAARQ